MEAGPVLAGVWERSSAHSLLRGRCPFHTGGGLGLGTSSARGGFAVPWSRCCEHGLLSPMVCVDSYTRPCTHTAHITHVCICAHTCHMCLLNTMYHVCTFACISACTHHTARTWVCTQQVMHVHAYTHVHVHIYHLPLHIYTCARLHITHAHMHRCTHASTFTLCTHTTHMSTLPFLKVTCHLCPDSGGLLEAPGTSGTSLGSAQKLAFVALPSEVGRRTVKPGRWGSCPDLASSL